MKTESRFTNWPNFKTLAESGAPIFIAIGAHEEHGPHCSLETDTIMSDTLAGLLADHFDGILLPALPYGECYTTSGYPGTISLRPDTLRLIALDIARGVHASHGTNLIFVNGHFGNRAPLSRAAEEMKAEGFPCLVLDYPGMAEIGERLMESKPPRPGFYHADEFETSCILASCPEGVDMSKAVSCYPQFPSDYDEKPDYLLSDFNPIGVFGDATKASAEKGQRFYKELTLYAIPVVEAFLKSIRNR